MNIKDIINRERCTIQPRNQHARSILVAHNAALERIEAAVLKRITELEAQVASAYKQGYDDGHSKGFTDGYTEKEQELK